ncbi:S8 family serine peptidase [Aestuariicoccus sp. MJ-SS9]|uniref:S8 family serine peptidase n=1 Tax=Aestuariicoccus sp. MJ-SS9 TaxID=3079855 RepID=UPI00290B7A18|nr:S8 family serine peptidase [Aestuariicoccus sp. MJ-SS9]MDU8914122.1 S8 family serine peptidase [Aestuariicoccus sp. MJ-SS9]
MKFDFLDFSFTFQFGLPEDAAPPPFAPPVAAFGQALAELVKGPGKPDSIPAWQSIPETAPTDAEDISHGITALLQQDEYVPYGLQEVLQPSDPGSNYLHNIAPVIFQGLAFEAGTQAGGHAIQVPPVSFVHPTADTSTGSDALASFGLLGSFDTIAVAEEPGDEPVQDGIELIVQFSAGASAADIRGAMGAVGGAPGLVLRENGGPTGEAGKLQVIKLGEGLSAERAVEILENRPGVEFAEPNFVFTVDTIDDPYFTNGSLWGMQGGDNTTVFGSHAADAWSDGNIGASTSIVGVIDTGLHYTHPDLYLNVWINQGEIPSELAADQDGDGLITFYDLNVMVGGTYVNSVNDLNGNGYIDAGDLLQDPNWANGDDEDSNGYTDDLVGWDFLDNDNNPFEAYQSRGPFGSGTSHGTHVAGTIGAIGGNGIGVVGVSQQVQIAALRFIGERGGSLADAILAIDYFTDQAIGALSAENFVATNNSWGGGGLSQALLDAITRGANEDVLFVASAGNDGLNTDQSAHYPSNYDTSVVASYDAVISVASINEAGGLSSFSNYGASTVDIGAPGEGIWSTFANGSYASASGTSMASPHVTGALALVSAAYPELTAEQLRTHLLDSAVPTGSLDGKTVTGGRLTIDAMLGLISGPAEPNEAPVALDDSDTTDEDTAVTVHVLFNDSDSDPDDVLTVMGVTQAVNGTVVINEDNTVDYTPNENFNGTDSFVYTISDGQAFDTATVTVTVNPVKDAPIVADDAFTIETGTTLSGNVFEDNGFGVDYDPDGDSINAVLGDGPSNGTVTLDSQTGEFDYTPNEGFFGTDSFTYTASDGELGSSLATVSITVNEPSLDVYGNDTLPDDLLAKGGIISGLSKDGTFNGAGTQDTLTGSDLADVFLFGDSRGVFYDDESNKPGGGDLDYALIVGFEITQDKLGLSSTGSYIATWDGADTQIYLDVWRPGSDSRDELIAIVEGVNLTLGDGLDHYRVDSDAYPIA